MLHRFEGRFAFRLICSTAFAGIASLAFAQAVPNTVAGGVVAYSLEELITIARRDSHVLHSARAQALAARAGVVSFPRFLVFQPIGVMPPALAHVEH